MSTGAPPPDTGSWEEAVTHGYYGQSVDENPADHYTVTGSGGGGAPSDASLTSVSPDTQATTVTGEWTVEGTGEFGRDEAPWRLSLLTAEGSSWDSLDVTAGDTTLTAYYRDGPNYPEAVGAGEAVLYYGNEEIGRVPFTWT